VTVVDGLAHVARHDDGTERRSIDRVKAHAGAVIRRCLRNGRVFEQDWRGVPGTLVQGEPAGQHRARRTVVIEPEATGGGSTPPVRDVDLDQAQLMCAQTNVVEAGGWPILLLYTAADGHRRVSHVRQHH
jgi:hypothetical protein